MVDETDSEAVDIAAEDLKPENLNGKAKISGAFEKPEPKSQLPVEIQNYLATHQLPSVFSLNITKKNSRTGKVEEGMECQNNIPSSIQIVEELGTGEFSFQFSKYNEKTARKERIGPPVEFVLGGPHYERIHRLYQQKLKDEDEEELERRRSRYGKGARPMETLSETIDAMKKLQPAPPPAIDLTPLAEAIRAQGENMKSMIETLNRPRAPIPEWLGTAIGGLITVLGTKLVSHILEGKKNDPEADPMKLLDKVVSIGEKLGAFKEALSPTPPDKWDRIIGLAETMFAPLIERLISLPPAERKADPTVKMITGTKEFKDLMGDPEGLKKFLSNFYAKFGARRTVIAMESCGMTASPEMKAEAEAESREEAAGDSQGQEEEAPRSDNAAPGQG